jgi:hypothetical protein
MNPLRLTPRIARIVPLLAGLAVLSCSLPTDVVQTVILTGHVRVVASLADGGGVPTGTRRIENADSLRVYLVHSAVPLDSTRSSLGVYHFHERPGTFLAVLALAGVSADTTGSIPIGGGDLAVSDTLVLAREGDLTSVPNPFVVAVRFAYTLTANANVSLRVVSLGGSPIRTLVNGPQLAGSYSFDWDGTNDAAVAVPNGIYGVVLVAGSETKLDLVIKGP